MTRPADLRREYSRATLDDSSVDADPIVQFRRWFDEAIAAALPEANTMTLATATPSGRPSARIVLLKGIDDDGFVFFTDYRSRKGAELELNPQAALVVQWRELERQVRVVGRAERVDAAASWEYYRTRPEGARIGAWASRQSSVIANRAALEHEVARTATRFAGEEIPLPPHWGGFRVVPDEIEFWQGRPDRLHDRIQYTRTSDQQWQRARLSP